MISYYCFLAGIGLGGIIGYAFGLDRRRPRALTDKEWSRKYRAQRDDLRVIRGGRS